MLKHASKLLFCRARVRLDAEYACGAKVYWFSCCSLDRNTSSHLTNQTGVSTLFMISESLGAMKKIFETGV
ncbi:uncharacterized, partial [Lates japonicus]